MKKIEIDLTKPNAILKHIQAEVEMLVPNWQEYSFIQINMNQPHSILYQINDECPSNIYNKIEKTIIEQAELIGIDVEFHD